MQCFSNFLLPFCFTVVFMFNLFLVLVKKSLSQQYIVSYIFSPPSRHISCFVLDNCKVLYKGMNGSVIFLRIPS